MIINYKDTFKMVGITIISFCAIFVCTLFLNYNLDLTQIESEVTSPEAAGLYDALKMTGTVVAGVSGGCLLLTTVVLLCFYIGHYIDTHKKELGILKALGYARLILAKEFWLFGLHVLIGSAFGYLGAHLLMPKFYETQNDTGLLPDFAVKFHPGLCSLLVVLPSVFFALLAVSYSYFKLRAPALELLREKTNSNVKVAKKDSDLPFLKELRRSNLRQRKSLVFFITFAVFCFSSMTQMSSSMDELSSRMMAIMIVGIGFTLACVTLFIATSSVIKSNNKTILMMKVFGYGEHDCSNAVLGGYRPWAYLGFALGTVYQYALLKIMVTFVFADVADVPDYQFDVKAMLVTFVLFLVLYEGIMLLYMKRMRKSSLKEVMLE